MYHCVRLSVMRKVLKPERDGVGAPWRTGVLDRVIWVDYFAA